MPTAAFIVLQALVILGGFGTRYQLRAQAGLEDIGYLMPRLVKRGWIYSPFKGLWAISERGKIVFAVEYGRRSKAIARGRIREYTAQLDRCEDWKASGRCA